MEVHLGSMENVSCWAFRKLCTGASDSYTGMLSIDYLNRRIVGFKEVDTYKIDGQRQWIQFAVSKEKDINKFLRRLSEDIKTNPEKDNIYGLQINASCPSPFIIKIGQGASLVKRPTKVSNLLKELLKQDKYKVSIKVRLGLNQEEVEKKKVLALFEEVEKIQDPNLKQVTVHFKHAKDRSSTLYNYDLLKEMQNYKIPLIINGGINSYNDFKHVIKGNTKNIIGFMVARGALNNPDIFIDINKEMGKKTISERGNEKIGKEFKELCEEHMPKSVYLEKIKSRTKWFPQTLEIPVTDEKRRGFYDF